MVPKRKPIEKRLGGSSKPRVAAALPHAVQADDSQRLKSERSMKPLRMSFWGKQTMNRWVILALALSMFQSMHLRLFGFQKLCGERAVVEVPQAAPIPPVAPIAEGDPVDELGDHLMLVFQDSKNNFWFGTWGDGVYRWNGRSIERFTTKHGLPHLRIDDILEDRAGNLYFNTSSGIGRFDGNRFSTISIADEFKLSDPSAWLLGQDDLWFKSPKFDGNVFRYDGQALHVLALPKLQLGEDYLKEHPNLSSLYAVYSIYRDNHNYVWFGTAALGACRFDGKEFLWISSKDVNELHDGPANGVRSIIEDRDGYVWFNTMHRYQVGDRPAGRVDQQKGVEAFKRHHGIGSLDGRSEGDFHEYMSIVKDDQGRLWMATYGAGVYCYDGKEIKHYPVVDGADDVTLFSIYKDRSGRIWLGSHDHGTFRLEESTFKRFRP